MFDANADHIKCGVIFFVEVHSVNEQLERIGVNAGDIILCCHQNKRDIELMKAEKAKLWLSNGADPVDYYDRENERDFSWLKYSGMPNGKGFINESWKAKALSFLGGSWNE